MKAVQSVARWIGGMALLLAVESFSACAAAQTTDDHVKQASEHAYAAFQRTEYLFRRSGRSDLINVLDGIYFEVDDQTPAINAFAYIDHDGRKKVVVSAQLVLLYYYFAEMFIFDVSQGGRWTPCILQYSNHVRDRYKVVLERALAEQAGPAVEPPEVYAARYGGACRGMERNYPMAENLKPQRNESVSNALGLVILHEIGHHYHQHTAVLDERLDLRIPAHMRRFLGLMCFSRAKEQQADDFAAKTIVDVGAWRAPVDQTFWAALMATGGLDPDFERGSTHPSPSRREAAVLNAVRSRMAAKGTPIPNQISELIDEFIAFQSKIERELPLTPIPGAQGISCE